jgi:PAS domain S-box-containing protein
LNKLSGYVFSSLREGDIALYRGSGNGLTPILLVAAEETSPGCVERLEHEYALKSELDADWAARPVALTHDNGRMTLVLEDPGGTPLDRLLGAPMEMECFLRLAIGIAVALGKLQQRGLVHKDVKPANILVNGATGAVKFTGFGIASRLPREHQAPTPPEVIAGTLAYMAPEQTGRMNRSIDSRSDLYALGVTLYEMLTGSLPFTAADPMEWVHCHIARKPVPPSERVTAVPTQVSAIVLKLLAKTAEDRYQTAVGLTFDLRRCLADSDSFGRVKSFPLGSQDVPDRLLIPEKLYGREREIDALVSAFDRVVAQGTPELVLVSGYSGVGKSSVVNELHKVLVPPRGLFASGKFDQYKRDIPYATLAQAFQKLIRRLLGQSEAELGRWRDALCDALGPNGQLVVNLIPEIELVIGKQPPVPELAPQDAQNRFQMVFRQLIGVFARPEHPLALFLDDLQWLDAATLDLLEHLITHPEVRHLLLVGAYRDNEVAPSHPLVRTLAAIRAAGAPVHEVVLAPLGLDDVRRLVADALHCDLERAQPLAGLVHEKTGGNPFFAIQFFTMLADEGLLGFDPIAPAWQWDIDRIRAKGYTENVVEFMVGKLSRLPDETQDALKLLACLGNVAEIATLTTVRGQSEHENPERAMHTALWEAVRAGLVFRLESAYTFPHDRIQQAAYSLIPDAHRADMHLRIGRALLESMTADELDGLLFDVANQLNRGAALLVDRDEKTRVAAINLRAARKAKASAAYASARVYLGDGMALLDETYWTSHYELTFSLWLECAECAFLTGELDRAEQLLAELLQRGVSKVDLAAVYELKVLLHIVKSQNLQAIDSALACLKLFGIDIPAHPSWEQVQAEYETLWRSLEARPIEDLIDLPLMQDPELQAVTRLLCVLSNPAYVTDRNLFCFELCRTLNLSMRHGVNGASAHACGYLGFSLGPAFQRYPEGFRLAKLGCDLVEKHGFHAYRAKLQDATGIAAFWTHPLATAIDFIRACLRTSIQTGDLTYACYGMAHIVMLLLLRNDPLDAAWRESEIALDFLHKSKFRDMEDILVPQRQFIAAMQGRTAALSTFNDVQFDEAAFEAQLTSDRMSSMICWYWVMKAKSRFLSGDHAEALAAADKATALIWSSTAHFPLLDHYYYTALTMAALYENASADERNGWRVRLAEHQQQLREWADSCPSTFADKHALVLAEIARIEGRDADAMRLYEQAVRSARDHGFVQNEGLAHEVAARFYTARGFETIAHAYLRNARSCYLRWGAAGKVRQLDQLYPHLRKEEPEPGPTSTIGAPVEHLDLATVIKVSQAVSGEIVLEKLIDTLMRTAIEHAGAERGLLILPRGDEQRIEAEATTGGNTIVVRLREASVAAAALPESIVHYVVRTQESVILDDASVRNPFSADTYVRQKHSRSVLCLPLLKQAKLIGVLYLENNLAPRVFAPARIAVLKLLASQAATSLENTRLYRDLAEREARIRRLVEANIIGIFVSDIDGQIIEANDAFLRMVGYDRGDLTAGRVNRTDLTPPEWRERDAQTVAELKASGTAQPFEKEYFRKDGSRIPVLIGVTTYDETRDHGVGFVLDLTERKRAELELRESEQNYRMLFESIDEGFCTIEVLYDRNEKPVDYRFLQVSPSFERQTGIKNAAGRRMREIAPQHEEHWFEIYGRIALTGEPMRFENEARQLGRWYDVYAFRVADSKRRLVGILFNDITERKRAEAEARDSERRYREVQAELAHANRVATMGQLSASITHEVNQPITAAVTYALAARRWLNADPPNFHEADDALSLIVKEGNRAGEVVGRIRALIKKAPARKDAVAINDAILEVVALTRTEAADNNVSVRTQLGEGLPHIQGDRVQLQQVLLNLIINAIEAMLDVGEGERELLISSRNEPDGVSVEVRDSGPGFAPADLERVFEAFYTTKPSGLGLGLSICRSIIEAHSGQLWASANLPRGASFQFALPAIANIAS